MPPTLTPTGAVVLPTAPSGLVCAPISSTQVNLAWTDNSTNEDYFVVQRWNNSNAWITIGATTQPGYGDSGLLPLYTYYYQVAATNTAGTSSYTPYCTVKMPGGLSPTPTLVPSTPTAPPTAVPPSATSTASPAATPSVTPALTPTIGPPNPPWALTASQSLTPGSIDLNWTYDPAVGPPTEGFYVDRCAEPPDANGNCASGWVRIQIPLAPQAAPATGTTTGTTALVGGALIAAAGVGYYLWQKSSQA